MLGSVLLAVACGGRSASDSRRESGTGGSSDASGGSGTAGDTAAGTGGDVNTGGSNLGGTGGTEAGSGTGGAPNCKGVVCAPIPKTCKMIAQEPGACCPTCPDTGCDPCPDLACAVGTHPDMAAGDCCPTCQPDPVDACLQGRADYTSLRATLLDKYGSSACLNSADCAVASEYNACNASCGVVLPASNVQNFENNTMNAAKQCASCPPPPAIDCTLVVPACVNGRCTDASATNN